jgi:ribosomal protein S18 acetylase RimI-like enzyme
VSAAVAIRRALLADAPALAEFGERCFRESYAAVNEPADIELHVARTYGLELQQRELADPAANCLLAIASEAIVGYALLGPGPAHPAVAGARPCEVRRFYVETTLHGRGVAPQLMLAATADARRGGAGTLWLTAWEHNPRALGFYAKMGFADVGAATFYLGANRQTDRVLALRLEA